MLKTDLIQAIAAQHTELKVKDVKAVVEAVFETARAELAAGNDVRIADFGFFSVVEKAERKGRNPQTGEEIIIDAHKAVKFSAAKALKDEVN